MSSLASVASSSVSHSVSSQNASSATSRGFIARALDSLLDFAFSDVEVICVQPEGSASRRIDNLYRCLFESSLTIGIRPGSRTVSTQKSAPQVNARSSVLPKLEVIEGEVKRNESTGREVRSVGAQIETMSCVAAPAIRRVADLDMRQE